MFMESLINSKLPLFLNELLSSAAKAGVGSKFKQRLTGSKLTRTPRCPLLRSGSPFPIFTLPQAGKGREIKKRGI